MTARADQTPTGLGVGTIWTAMRSTILADTASNISQINAAARTKTAMSGCQSANAFCDRSMPSCRQLVSVAGSRYEDGQGARPDRYGRMMICRRTNNNPSSYRLLSFNRQGSKGLKMASSSGPWEFGISNSSAENKIQSILLFVLLKLV